MLSHDPDLSVTGMLVVIWVETVIALGIVGVRFLFRRLHRDRLTWDDAFVALGAACMVTMSALYTPVMPAIYLLSDLTSGKTTPPPDFIAIEARYLKHQFAIIILFWSILWSVKGAFMTFYKQMFGRQFVGWQTWAWWVVAAICILTFVANFILQFFACVPLWTYFHAGACSTASDFVISNASLYFQTAVDIFDDILIAILPLSILWDLKKGLKTRVALGVLFSSGGVIILFAVLRLVFTMPNEKQVNPKWLAVMSSTEAMIALAVSCAPPFRKYFAVRGGSANNSKYRGSADSNAYSRSEAEKAGYRIESTTSVKHASEQNMSDELLALGSPRNSKQLAAHRDFWRCHSS